MSGAAMTCLALLICSTLSPEAHAAATAACMPMMADQPPVFEMNFDVGSAPVHRQLLLPANRDILLLAREQDIDVRIEIDRGATVVAMTDNPILRTGTQRAAFRTVPGAPYVLQIISKEHGATGRVEVRAVALSTNAPEDGCIAANRALAVADAKFAVGQLITLGIKRDSATSAESSYKSSAGGYAAVAASLAAAGPSALLGEAQHAEAEALYSSQDWEASCMAAERAMVTYQRAGSDYAEARARALLAAALMETAPTAQVTCGESPQDASESRPERFQRLFTAAAAFHGKRGDIYDQAQALNNLGLAFLMSDDLARAKTALAQALLLYERAAATQKQAQVLQNMALADYQLGRLSDALQLYGRALALLRPEDDPTLYATILANSGVASTFAGDHDTALRQLGTALTLSRSVQDKWWQVLILDNIGLVYDRIGEKDLALDFYNQSLTLGSAALISSGRRNTLSKMASILRDQGDYARALAARKEALSLASSPATRALVSIYLAADYRAAGNFAEATRLLDAILSEKSSASGDYTRASALLERGHLAADEGALEHAESDYGRAARIFRALDVPAREFAASLGLARTQYRRGSPDRALQELTRTLQLAEELRQQSANPELRATLLQTSRPAFDLRISILADRYFAKAPAARTGSLALDALRTAEQARARAFDDFTRLDMSAAGAAPQLLQQRETIYAELASRQQRIEALLETTAPTNPLITAIRADVATLRQRLNDIDAQLAATSIRAVAPDPQLSIDPRVMPDDAVVVEYWLGQERALAWTLSRDGIGWSDLGSSTAITDRALALHTALRSFGKVTAEETLQQAQRLYDLVVAPLQSSVGSRRALTVVADGALHYVPFGVLRAGRGNARRLLIQDHDVAVAPSSRALFQAHAASQATSAQRMLLVADPVYGKDDVRVAMVRRSGDPGSLQRLPGTAAEAATIRGLFSKSALDSLEGATATRERFLATDFRSYRFIHIASHAVANSEIPQLSALILSTVDQRGHAINGRVLAADLLNVRLNTQLLVLSGCETALGKSVAGEGLIGLQYIMLARGAGSVMSSLWEVPDRETAQLMAEFYADLLARKQSPRRSLSNAMRTMLAAGSDPGTWGAFVLTTSEID